MPIIKSKCPTKFLTRKVPEFERKVKLIEELFKYQISYNSMKKQKENFVRLSIINFV